MSAAGRPALICTVIATAAACGKGERTAPPVATDRVNLPKSYEFAPTAITVRTGATVTWVNADVFTHAVRLTDDGGAVLVMKPGDSVHFTFSTPGLHHYDCSFHPHDMRGTVLVTAAP